MQEPVRLARGSEQARPNRGGDRPGQALADVLCAHGAHRGLACACGQIANQSCLVILSGRGRHFLCAILRDIIASPTPLASGSHVRRRVEMLVVDLTLMGVGSGASCNALW